MRILGRIKKLYFLIITIFIPLIIVSGIVSRFDKHEQEILEITNQNEFKIGDIHYRVLSFEDMIVEVSNGNKCKGKVVIPSKVQNGRNEYTVVQIGREAFEGNKDIASLTMPNTIVSVLDEAFSRCEFASFTPSENITYVSTDAFGSKAWGGGKCPVKPQDGVIYIGKVAFQYKSDMNDNASGFLQFDKRTSITIKEGTIHINNNAFEGCKNLKSVTLPNSLRTIGKRAFYDCWRLNSVIFPPNIEYIGESAFEDCYDLASISVPTQIVVIGKNAFERTKWYKGFFVEGQNVEDTKVDTIELHSHYFEETQIEKNVETKEPAKNGSYEVENNLIYIGSVLYGFKEPVSYGTEIVVRDGTLGIAESVFSGCSGIVSVKLPGSIIAIGERAFENCKGLEHINIPQSIKMVGKNSFVGCVSLEKEAMQVDGTYGRGIYNDYILY